MASNVPESFCVMPFLNLQMDTSGEFRPCSKIQMALEERPGKVFRLPESQLNEVWNNSDLEALRDQFRNGERPDVCRVCWDEESAGIKSLRQARVLSQEEHESFLEKTPDSPIDLDLKPSNQCNLKCRICNPLNSTGWQKEAVETLNYFHPDYFSFSAEKFVDENLSVLKDWFQRARMLEIHGGEPLINKEHTKLLKLAIEAGNSRNIILNYTSNGTHFSPELVELWSEFQHVGLGLSLDGVGKRFEFQRFPAKWEPVTKVVEAFSDCGLDKLSLRFEFSLSVMNVFYMGEFLDWADDFPKWEVIYNFVHNPEHYCIKSLPAEAKDQALGLLDDLVERKPHRKQELQSVKEFMQQQDLSERWPDFIRESKRADQYRGQRLEETFPKLRKWVQL